MRKPVTKQMVCDWIFGSLAVGCRVCNVELEPGDAIEWDHATPLALGGEHHYRNLRPLHRECHRIKTSGSGATTAGSDIGKIKKMRHIATGKMEVKKGRGGDGYEGGLRRLAPRAVSVVAPEQKSLTSPTRFNALSSVVANAEQGYEPSPSPKPKRHWPSREFPKRRKG